MRAAAKKNSVEAEFIEIVRFTWARDTFGIAIEKTKKTKKVEKVENGVKSQSLLSTDVTFPIEKVHIPPWDATVAFTVWRFWRWGAKRKTKKRNQRFLRVVRFTQTRDTFLPVTKKGRKGEKDRKSWKRCQMNKKSIMVRNRPQSGTKQSIWRKYKTGLYELMSVWSQKMMQKGAFDLHKMIIKPVWF